MNENDLQNKEINNKKFLSLKEENEDNLIENKSYIKKKIEKFEEKEIKNEPNYKLDYKRIFEFIEKPNEQKINDQKELLSNLLLIPSDIDIQDKLKALYHLSKFYQKGNKKEQTIRAAIKFEKFVKSQKDIAIEYYINCYHNASSILCEDYQNFFYAWKYSNSCLNIITILKNKLSESDETQIKNNHNLITQFILSYLEDKKKLFSDSIIDENAQKIRELINLILDEKNNKETDENDENKKYLYVINKDWIFNLIAFIVPFVKEHKSKSSKLIEKCFVLDYLCEAYLKDNEDKIKKNQKECDLFPGPIDNFKITSFKDSWKDNENLDENDYIKKNSQYYFVNYEDWNLLNSHFGCTNIIRRKKNNLDLISLKFVLLDKRINVTKRNLKLLRERYIQVNKSINIKSLKEKILRCANNELKKDEEEKEICFYIVDRDKSHILIEIIYAFANSLQMYESLYIKKVEIKDEENLDNLFSIFEQKKHFLIIEIIKKDDMNFLFQIDKNANKCTICGTQLKDENEIYKCKVCNFSLFCSKKCANNSDIHVNLDNLTKQLFEEKFNLEDILSSKYNYLLKNGGQGNKLIKIQGEEESFFTSSIYCLSNTFGLTKYFLAQLYKQEQKTGLKSYISNLYFNLVKALWEFGYSNVFTIDVKKFCQLINLKNYQNLEPTDFIYNFFEKLNEEFNRVPGDYKEKEQEEEQEQKEGESDEEASKRFLNNLKKRKNSIITDLFVGQLKESSMCITCNKIYTKFPYFYWLKLPVPDKKLSIQIKLFTNNLIYQYVNVKINEKTEMKDILFKSIEYLKKSSYIQYLFNIKTNDGIFNHNITSVPDYILYNQLIFIEINKEFKVGRIYNTSFKNCPTDKNNNKNPYYKSNKICFDLFKYTEYKETCNKRGLYELVIFEKDPSSIMPGYIPLLVYPIAELEKVSMLSGATKKYHKILSYPVILAIDKNESLDNLKNLIFTKFKKVITIQFQTDENSIELFYPHLDSSWDKLRMKDGKCPICQKTFNKTGFCCNLFEGIEKSKSVKDLMEKQGKDRDLILYAKSYLYDESKYIYQGLPLSFSKNNEIETKESISLYDSFDIYITPKIETEENWFCKNCNKNRIFQKTINLYKLPNYLILQLKKGKNDKLIDYKNILDLKEYTLEPNKDNSLYDLYAVILYKKSFNSSSYSCYYKLFNIWFKYDDDVIEPINNPIDKDAYILFYKKRNID